MLVIIAAIASLAQAREYLTEVVGPVYEAPGTPESLATAGEVCLSRVLPPPPSGGEIIVSRNVAGGVVVASHNLEYRDGLVPWRVRSRMSFEARDGRFRIIQTNIERHNDQGLSAQFLGASPWVQIGKWRGSGWQKAEQALLASADRVAECVKQPAKNNDW